MQPLWQSRYEVARVIGLIPADAEARWTIPEMLKVIDKQIHPSCRPMYYYAVARKLGEIVERTSR